MSASTSFESAAESRVWVMLHLQAVEKAKSDALAMGEISNFKDFCQGLRASKLHYWNQDRQEPGVFDSGAGLLIEWSDEVLEVIDESGNASLLRVKNGIRGHRGELVEHLETPLDQRKVIL